MKHCKASWKLNSAFLGSWGFWDLLELACKRALLWRERFSWNTDGRNDNMLWEATLMRADVKQEKPWLIFIRAGLWIPAEPLQFRVYFCIHRKAPIIKCVSPAGPLPGWVPYTEAPRLHGARSILHWAFWESWRLSSQAKAWERRKLPG